MGAFKFAALSALVLLGLGQNSLAAVAQNPLLQPKPAKPNIMYTLDNSRSMLMVSLTSYDGLGAFDQLQETRAFYSSAYNLLYYNPAIRYTPGVKSDGTLMPASDPASAPLDPYPTDSGSKQVVNLKAECYSLSSPVLPFYEPPPYGNNDPIVAPYNPQQTNCKDVKQKTGYTVLRARYAHYYVWDGKTDIARKDLAKKDDPAFPTRVDIVSTVNSYPKAATRTDCAGATCTYSEEIQNFANWFSYYRTRILMAKTALGQAFAGLDANYRVGFNTINGIDEKGNVTSNNSAAKDGRGWLTIRDFTKAQKDSFYSKLYAIDPNGNTPLRAQLNRIGKMFEGTLAGFDYAKEDPFFNDPASLDYRPVSCRANYHILSTDGFWNDSSGMDNFPTVGDQDGTGGGNTLADVAKYYYKTDLRTGAGFENNVPPSSRDPATHQHVVTFTVGLGANGKLPYDENYYGNPAYTETKANGADWPKPVENDPTTIDDLWHAAVNGKGRYFSAKNPVQLRDGLIKALNDIASRPAANSTIAVNIRSSAAGNGLAYVPSYEPNTWLGHLKSYKIKSTGEIETSPQWDAATLLPAWSARNIATVKSKSGIAFDWGSLSADQQTLLGSRDVLEYLRGNGAKETAQSGGVFRDRATKLGDIVNSPVIYVKDANFGYDRLPDAEGGGQTYRNFVADKSKKRLPMIFAGANDGMLHGFDASSGVEKFAFVPGAVFPKLKALSDPKYSHQYYVDGQVVEGDVYLGGKWSTVLLGSAGAGAKSVFALNVTDPAALGSSSVLWELTNNDDADLGYVLGKPAVVKMSNGSWAAVFGNGYESKNGHAALFIVDIATGAVKKLDTGSTAAGNGLSAPAFLFDSQRRVVAIYAGDSSGSLWKFDVSQEAAKWQATRLFTAKDGTGAGNFQPIVQRPALGHHPKGGVMVMFGTGKFFEQDDATNTNIQTIYGIWDKPEASGITAARSDILVKGTLSMSTKVNGGIDLSIGAIDWTSKRGWYIDLDVKTKSGERTISDPFVLDNLLWVTTLSPENDGLCKGTGVSILYAIDFMSGGPNAISPFDLNNNGKFDDDGTTVGLPGGGTTGGTTVYDTPRCVDPNAPDCKNGKPSCAAGDASCLPECSGAKRNLLRNNLDNTTSLISVAPSCKPPKRAWRQIPYSY